MASGDADRKRTFRVQANDGVILTIEEKVLRMSEVLVTLTDLIQEKNAIIPLQECDSHTLSLVFQFCQHFKNAPPYEPPKLPMTVALMPAQDSWEMQFLNVPGSELEKIIQAADFLNVPRLIDACCYRLSWLAKGKSVEELRELFCLENDFTPEEEAELEREHQWYDKRNE